MATLIIPVRADLPAYKFQIDLEAKLYTFKFRYNERMDRWVMDIADENENALLSGIAILTDWDLIGRFKNDALPPGTFLAMDESGERKYAAREDLGNDIKLFYIESDAA